MPAVRLNKFLAERIGVSRREADELIARGKILVDGAPAKIGAQVSEGSHVSYRGKAIPFETEYIYMMLHKPVGYVSSRRRQGETPTLYELLPDEFQHLKTVGRLDKDSSGLILLTNDGDFAFQMTHPKFAKTKVYEVALDKPLSPAHEGQISGAGVNLPDGISRLGLEEIGDQLASMDPKPRRDTPGDTGDAPAALSPPPAPRTRWRVTMHEGRNRQIRRTFAALGYNVVRLHRTQFGPYTLDRLSPAHHHLFHPSAT